ncbi:class I SAM-dependent methyltransferase [Microbacterium sp. HD4P20]|uniref:class I SAM-dependent methyltransferase n=1 Tax=Microbacterium sp. HD4P20 TaxID=2864874 RepID=UPI001C6439F0|nr:class I SAM-dependent methyltransferase [Microbacterium sp. HD4P20]MCP2636282.1 class I SAM-dependent methyltransferase [Microbacterium sp. HD4P20]
MVDGADAAGWSEVAAGWSALWGSFAAPAQDKLIARCGIGSGTRVLDVGCGSGEFLARLRAIGAEPVGADPAPAMAAAASVHAPVVEADAEHLPFDAGRFDVVTAVNALQFADDTVGALREFARVVVPGGRIGIANWAEAARSDIDVIERAVAEALDEEQHPDGPLRPAGGIEDTMMDAGLEVVASGIVATPWRAGDDTTLVRGILLGEDAATLTELHGVVVAAAAPFRGADGGYVLRNHFRWAVAVTD